MKFERGERRSIAICAIVIALPLGIGLFFNHLNAPPKVDIPSYPQAATPNGFALYIAASRALVPAKPAVDFIMDDFAPSDEKARLQRYSLARKTAWRKANQNAFVLFERAQKTPTLAPSMRSSRAIIPIKLISGMWRAKFVEFHTKRMGGDYEGAFQSGLDAIQFGHDIRRGAPILLSIIGAENNDKVRTNVGDLVDRLSAPKARSAARRLENLLQARWNLDDALVENKYFYQLQWLRIFEQPEGWRYSLLASDAAPTATAFAHSYLISKQAVIDETEAEFDREIANARLPYAQKGAPAPEPSGLVFDEFASNAVRLRYLDARDLAGDRLLLLQLALRAYCLERGQYPPAPSALVPAYLKAIPADPFGAGEPVHYKRSGTKYILWSVGPDEKNDGGSPIPPNKDEKNFRAPLPSEAPRLPGTLLDSKGDFVAGENQAVGFEWPRID